jgi:septum formation protein
VKIMLASESAARRRLLAAAGVAHEAEAAGIDEGAQKRAARAAGQDAAECALALAIAKAVQVSLRRQGATVIGADQMLVCERAWFDKPRDLAEARQQLVTLRGREHRLVTTAAAVEDGETVWRHVAVARLVMRPFSDQFLDDYLAAMGERVCGTVGGYELEGLGAQLFDRIEGDYFAILGLPLLPLLQFLRGKGAIPT